MADKSIDSPVAPKKKGSNTGNRHSTLVRNRRASIGSYRAVDSLSRNSVNRHSTLACNRRASIGSYGAVDCSLRNSSEKSDADDSSLNVVPHYLRASTGSCHDFCKYGIEHSSEKKERRPLWKSIAKPLPSDPYSVQILVSDDLKKEKVVYHGALMVRQNHSPDQKRSSDIKLFSSEHKSSGVPSPRTKPYFRKPKMPSDAKSYSTKENGSSGNMTLLSKSKPSYTKKFPSADPLEIVKSVIFPSTAADGSAKQGLVDNRTERAERKRIYVSQKHSSPLKSKPLKVEPSSSENSDFIRGEHRRNINGKTEKIVSAFKEPAKKVLVASTAPLSHKPSMNKTVHVKLKQAGNFNMCSPSKDQNRIRKVKTKESNDEKVDQKVPKRTLHVIKMETDNNISKSTAEAHPISSLPSPSTESLSYTDSPSSSSSHEDDNTETEQSSGVSDEVPSDNNDVQPVIENQNRTLRKSRVVVPEDKCRSAMKLKFRSGKVVDVQSDNNNPRRLRFRRSRVLGAEDSKGNSRRALKKAEANNKATGVEVSSEKVVLKHQDVPGKKDAQGLLNNVIEETASKLVESRKSKVKALVGAFETVISLQESKHAA